MRPKSPAINSAQNSSGSNGDGSSSDSGAISDIAADKPTNCNDSSTAMTSSNDTMTAANATSVAETVQMSPSSCTVLIVDKRFLKGVYHTTGSGGSPTMRAGPALDDVVFVQELLEIYGQVVAVVSGDTALRWIFNHTGNKAIIVLIDVDETYELTDDSCDNQHSSNSSDSTLYGPIYTPPASPQKQQADTSGDPDSEFSGPYGLVLLRVIAHYVAIGVFRNVAPIAMSTSHDPLFMRQAANLGAMNYLVKPISAETVHSLWLNVFSCRTHTHNKAAGITSTITPQQMIFQRRIRADTVNGTFTADARNAAFEEDFIRQFVPAITQTLPEASNGAMKEAGSVDTPPEEPEDNMDYFDEGFINSPRANVLRSRLMEWAFSPYDMDREELLDCAAIMIMDSAACVELKLQLGRVRRFVKILESAYYDNPYHNFHHAVDVTQCTFYILHTLGMFNKTEPRRLSLRSPAETSFPLRTILRPTDVMALIVASLCHDLGHPGLNNAFMVRARTQLAELYNDQSVLENFHAACFSMVMSYYFTEFVLSRQSDMQQNGHAASFDYEEFRRIAVHAILATDMARHFEFIGKCKAQYERFVSGSNLPLTTQQHEAERAQLAASILKCADISNLVRPFNISQRWTQRLNREVTLQGNIEESLGLSRSIVVDHGNVPASQIAFYETCGRPLFNAVADLVPELRFMPDQLENNIRNWSFIKNNQKVPEVPYGLKHSSTYDLSISTRAGSTDSAPDFMPKRMVLDKLQLATAPMEESGSLANYTLHMGESNLNTQTPSPCSDGETDDEFADARYLNPPSAAHVFAPASVASPSPHLAS